MWFNAITHAKSYQFLVVLFLFFEKNNNLIFKIAWLSSIRVVKCIYDRYYISITEYAFYKQVYLTDETLSISLVFF